MIACENPYTKDGLAFPCGGCLPCRIKRKRTWTHRLILEATQHSENAFVTLTYDDTNLPSNGHLVPTHLTNFIKRLRHKWNFRYFASGEYGDHTERPHYHLLAFGAPTCERGQTDLRKTRCCTVCDHYRKTWTYGAVQVARLETASCAYTAGYVTKKLTAKPLSAGLPKEFTRMSLKPGIGYGAVHDIASVLLQYKLETKIDDVPTMLQHGTTKLPLGKYLRKNLRRAIGRDEKCPQIVMEKMAAEMLDVRETAFYTSTSFAKAVAHEASGKIASIKAKHKIRESRKTL